MEKRFYTITQRRAAQPRSKRLRELGVGSVNVGGVNVTVGGGVGTVGGGDGHTHGNKTALDEIGVDDDRYIYLTKTVDVESNDSAVMASEKAKVGYADESGEAQIAAEAGHATAADRANYAGDSDKWDGNQFADYLDQPVRRTDVVSHAEVRSDSIRDLGETFVDGLLGSGMRMWRDENGVTYLTLDHLTVRQRMTVLELLIERIRSVGGQLIVSAANGKMASVGESGEDYEIGFEQKCEFLPGDLLRCQTFTGSSLKSYWVEVDRYILGKIYIKKSQFDEWGCRPEAGDEVVLMGSTTNEGRQSVVRISATEDGQPRMDVLNGISGKTLDGSLRARLGNLDGISDSRFPADGQPQGDGLYADNAYLRGTFLLKNRGQDVETLFSVMEGKIQSSVTAVRDDFLGDNSYLSNAAFADGLQGWKTENSTVFYLAGNKWIWANGNVLGKHGTGASVTEDMGRTVVRIKEGYIKQMNAAMRSKPTFATNASGEKEAVPVYLTFFYRCASTGAVGIGFNNVDKSGFADFDSLAVLRELTATEGYVQFSCEGLWNGTGDFTLSFGGEIYLYGLVLSTDKVEALKYGYRTLFEQSDKLVNIAAQNFDADGNVLTESGIMTTAQMTGLYAIDSEGQLCSLVGVGQEGIKIKAEHISLEGIITANGNIQIREDGSLVANKGKFTGVLNLSAGYGGFTNGNNIIYMAPLEAGVTKNMTFPWENVYEDIGKVIRFYNSSPAGGGKYVFTLYSWHGAKDGTFGSQKETYSVVVLPQETVEITNFLKSDDDTSYECEWELTSRFGPDNFRTSTLGRFPRMLAMGRLVYSTSDSSVGIEGKLWDNRGMADCMTAERLQEGRYKISFDAGLLPSGYKVMACGYGSWTVKACVQETASDHFSIGMSDDSSENDSSCEIMILSPDWSYSV